jgi:phosphohistidine phosphatase SixA
MRIILIRHGERVRERNVPDKDCPLSETGRCEAMQLREAFTPLNLNPQVYLTSTHLHAQEMGNLLAKEYDARPAVQVMGLTALTPIKPPGNIEQIATEALQVGYDLGQLEEVAIVGHEPYLGQLVARLTTARCRPLARAEVVCLLATSWPDFLQGKGKIEFRYPIADYQEKQLRPKIQSKMSVSTFLAGFTFNALFAFLLAGNALSPPKTVAAFFLTFSLALFVAAVYMYDRLSMPEGFWAYGERTRLPSPRGRRFEEDRRYHGDLYAYMVWTWSWVFTPAVAFGLAGFVALLLDAGNVILFIASLAALAAVGFYYWATRPRLGVD